MFCTTPGIVLMSPLACTPQSTSTWRWPSSPGSESRKQSPKPTRYMRTRSSLGCRVAAGLSAPPVESGEIEARLFLHELAHLLRVGVLRAGIRVDELVHEVALARDPILVRGRLRDREADRAVARGDDGRAAGHGQLESAV